MTNNVLVFAGTFEGRKICEYLLSQNINVTACVATEYGRICLDTSENLTVHSGRLDEAQIGSLISCNKFEFVIDATHPFAKVVSENIKSACDTFSVEYVRLLRDDGEFENVKIVSDTYEAAQYLKKTEGNILLTTGSKELSLFCQVPDFKERIYARVLSSSAVLSQCEAIGFLGSHIIAAQGPFSHEYNVAMLKQYDCKILVTKSTGNAGGLYEKLSAAKEVGAEIVLIERPVKEMGCELEDMKHFIDNRLLLKSNFHALKILVSAPTPAPPIEHFPFFLPVSGKKVLVIGGGKIASRRVQALAKFCFEITVISPKISAELEELLKSGRILHLKREFQDEDIQNFDIVIAATDIRMVNSHVGQLSRENNLLCNVADSKEECDFFFPAIITEDTLSIALVGDGSNHRKVSNAAQKIRKAIALE